MSQWESYEYELNGLGPLAAVGSSAVQQHAITSLMGHPETKHGRIVC